MQINCTLAKVATRRVGADAGERSDDFLICAIGKGDKLSMKILFARHNVRVYRFALRLTRDELLAEDVVSEVFLHAWRGAKNFQAKSKVSTWLLATTKRLPSRTPQTTRRPSSARRSAARCCRNA